MYPEASGWMTATKGEMVLTFGPPLRSVELEYWKSKCPRSAGREV
jgi:hypothetical protein